MLAITYRLQFIADFYTASDGRSGADVTEQLTSPIYSFILVPNSFTLLSHTLQKLFNFFDSAYKFPRRIKFGRFRRKHPRMKTSGPRTVHRYAKPSCSSHHTFFSAYRSSPEDGTRNKNFVGKALCTAWTICILNI